MYIFRSTGFAQTLLCKRSLYCVCFFLMAHAAKSMEGSSTGASLESHTALASGAAADLTLPAEEAASMPNGEEDVRFDQILDAFKKLEELLQNIEIRIDRRAITSLKAYLEGDEKPSQEALSYIEQAIEHSLPEDVRYLILSHDEITLHKAVMVAFNEHVIDGAQVNTIMSKALPIKPREAIRLMENGIVYTENGHVVELKVGDSFGDVYAFSARVGDPTRRSSFVNEARKMLLFLNFSSFRAFDGTTGANEHNFLKDSHWRAMVSLEALSTFLFGTYSLNDSTALRSFGFVNSFGFALGGAGVGEDFGPNWWTLLSEDSLGFGGSMTFLLQNGQLWSNSGSGFITAGGRVSSWKDYLQDGISAATARSSGAMAGGGILVGVTRNYDMAYQGMYPLDGKYPEIRGMHKLEIIDKRILCGALAQLSNATILNVPPTFAFRAGVDHTRHRVYRTHRKVQGVEEALKDGGAPGLAHILGESIENTTFPSFLEPEKLQVGDELVEMKSGVLMGTFLFGVQSYGPMYAVRVGANLSIKGEFELGLKRLPQDKFEVSVEPLHVIEVGAFETAVNIENIGATKGVAFAKKQVFVFDFKQRGAREAYDALVHDGRLPMGNRSDEAFDGRSPEDLLARFRKENVVLKERGIQRIYLEKINISTKRFFAGINAPFVGAIFSAIPKRFNKKWAGLSLEYLRGKLKSVATNGLVAIERKTSGKRKTRNQGTSGTYNKDLFVTSRKVHSLEELSGGDVVSSSQFDSLLLHARLEDTRITGNEENKMADYLNALFHTYFGDFAFQDSKQPRTVDIERTISRKELEQICGAEAYENIHEAYMYTGVSQTAMRDMMDAMKLEGPDARGKIVYDFLEKEGIEGFAAIHHLLGGRAEDLVVRTEGGYTNAINAGRTFTVNWANLDPEEKKRLTKIRAIQSRKEKRNSKKFYRDAHYQLKNIDNQLRYLHDDKYFADTNDRMASILGPEVMKKMVEEGKREDKTKRKEGLVATRMSIVEYLELEKQGYSANERLRIYKMAHERHLRIFERAELLLNKYAFEPVNADMPAKRIRKQYREFWDLIDKIRMKIHKLENDEVMEKMDPNYVKDTLEKMKAVEAELLAHISIEHLTAKQLESMLEKLHGGRLRRLVGHRRENYRLEGAIRQTLYRKQKDERKSVKEIVPSEQTTNEDKGKEIEEEEVQTFQFGTKQVLQMNGNYDKNQTMVAPDEQKPNEKQEGT